MIRNTEDWSYFRAGGVVQVDLKSLLDLQNLKDLDQKLWMALAMPTRGVSVDSRTLDAIDTDRDGRIRPPEILAAVSWLSQRVKNINLVWENRQDLALEELSNPILSDLGRGVLQQAGKSPAQPIELADLDQALGLLTHEIFNGDGVIIPECSDEPATRELLAALLKVYGGVPDRSGKLGIDRNILALFKEDLQSQITWQKHGKVLLAAKNLDHDAMLRACDSWQLVCAKITDYFTRCRWVDFDARADQAANRLQSDFDAIGKELLTPKTNSLAQLPLAVIQARKALPLETGLNPAWTDAMRVFVHQCLIPIFEHKDSSLTEDQWQRVSAYLQVFIDWRESQPQNPLRCWNMAQLNAVPQDSLAAMEALILKDELKVKEYDQLQEILTILLYVRDLGQILRNFVNFSDFYRGQTALFQVGRLFIDGRSMQLCIDVSNPAKHATIAGLAGAYLLYCECRRPGHLPRSIVALLTDGDSDNIMVGRNGVFYDLEGADWDATVTRIVTNPISLREAFWSPYKSLARFIEEQVSKRAGSAHQDNQGELAKTAETLVHAEKKDVSQPALVKSKFDPGTVAAIGVALGSIGTFFGLIFSKFIDLGILMPFGILALFFLISGPSVVLAWLKLRNRNLGPILDANGWAINTSARINVPFAASMTRLRTFPLGAGTSLTDPYAEAKRPWKTYSLLCITLFLMYLWSLGKCNSFLPTQLQRQVSVEATLR